MKIRLKFQSTSHLTMVNKTGLVTWAILPEAYYVRGEQVAGCYIFKFISCEFCRHFQTYYSQADKIKQLKASMSFNKSYILCSRKIIHLNIRANTPHLLLYLWSGNLIIKCLILPISSWLPLKLLFIWCNVLYSPIVLGYFMKILLTNIQFIHYRKPMQKYKI